MISSSLQSQTILFAILGGLAPALFWLWFWLREDTIHPEPRTLIALSFFAGMIAAPLALPLERMVSGYNLDLSMTFLLWAFIEEVLKFGAVAVTALYSKDMDEPVDSLIYFITAALGFTAIENTFFLLHPLANGNIIEGVLTGNLRFIGASLLHTVSSASIGIFIALSFYKPKASRFLYTIFGILLATTLHTLFNFFIIKQDNTFMVFSAVWLCIIVLMVVFEKVKQIMPLARKS